ncbi:MAG: hypothetical protein ACLPUO_14875 [Streptosporangiaceae bacterium]|jgi:hypothetical protein
MADVLVLEFTTPQAVEIYHSVNHLLGLDNSSDSADWPGPMHSHVAGEAGSKLIVVEVWESRAAQEKFMESQLGPAFEKANVPQPSRVEWFAHVGEMCRH